jgi:tRNA1(Val) A37 N6-methylase TrmN6
MIVVARKGVKTPSQILPGLVLHDENGISPAAEAILRGGAALG